MRYENIRYRTPDGTVVDGTLSLLTSETSLRDDDTESVMHDVHAVLNWTGIRWEDVARILIPLAFRLLCMSVWGNR